MTYTRKYFSLLFTILSASSILFSSVTISIGDVQVDGYTEDIVVPVTLSNPENIVGGFQFDVIVLPTLIELSGASAVDADAVWPRHGSNAAQGLCRDRQCDCAADDRL